MTNNIYSTITTSTKDTEECVVEYCGGWSDATTRLDGVTVHDVDKVTQRTQTIKGTKYTTITMHTAEGSIAFTAVRTGAEQ